MGLGDWWGRRQEDLRRFRSRHALFDHLAAVAEHYGKYDGAGQAGAVSYFGFLAFFPILALIFAVLGFVYAGLGWMSALRNGLSTMFVKPLHERPDFLTGRLRDATVLLGAGGLLFIALGLISVVNLSSQLLLEFVGLDPDREGLAVLLRILGASMSAALVAAMVYWLSWVLVKPEVGRRPLAEGAAVVAVGFLALTAVADQLISLTAGRPAFTVFGFTLVLLVLINYFSRVVMLGASWAYTSPRSLEVFQGDVDNPHQRD